MSRRHIVTHGWRRYPASINSLPKQLALKEPRLQNSFMN